MHVTVMVLLLAGHLLGRRDATFLRLAAYVLKLDGRVVDCESPAEQMIQIDENTCTF